jgi:hypothetical protein
VPDSTEYLARIRELGEGQDFLAVQRETPKVLSELIEHCSAEELSRRPRPDKWSVVEIIAHLAEDELATSWRYRQMLENNGTALAGFDQDLWARAGHYSAWTPDDALSMFRLLREANLRLLDHLFEEEWQRFGVHAERGRITIRDLACHMAGHDLNHLRQVHSILAH